MSPAAEGQREAAWRVYDELRTALLNACYYDAKRRRWGRFSNALDIATGLTTSSVIAALGFWETIPGRGTWAIVGLVGGLAAILKPPLRVVDRTSACEESAKGYNVLANDLQLISESIRANRAFTADHQRSFDEALQRRRALVEKEPERTPNAGLVRKCQAIVNQEFPVTSFFDPITEEK
jgi:hypothetical protein